MVDDDIVDDILGEIQQQVGTNGRLRAPDKQRPEEWAREAAGQIEPLMEDVSVVNAGAFAETNFKLPSPVGTKPSRDILSNLGFRADGLNSFVIRYPRVSEEEVSKDELTAVGEDIVDGSGVQEYVDRVRINEGGIGGGRFWLHIEGKVGEDVQVDDIMPLLREAADGMNRRAFDSRGYRAPTTRADFTTQDTKRLYDGLSEIVDIVGTERFSDGGMLIEFHTPDPDIFYPSALSVDASGRLKELTLRLGPLGLREETPDGEEFDIEGRFTDVVLSAASSVGVLEELDLQGYNIDLGDEWIAPQLRPHVRINDRRDENSGSYAVGPREIVAFIEEVVERFDSRFGTLEQRRLDPDMGGRFRGGQTDLMRAPAPVSLPDPFSRKNVTDSGNTVVIDFTAPGTDRRLPSTLTYDGGGVDELSLRLPRLYAPEQTRNVRSRVRRVVEGAAPPIPDIEQNILQLGEVMPNITDTISIKFRDNGESMDPHVEFSRSRTGPRIAPEAMVDFCARVFRQFQQEYALDAGEMRAPEVGDMSRMEDFPAAVQEFAQTADGKGFQQVKLNYFPRQDRSTVQWSFKPIADDALLPGVLSALSVGDDAMVDEYTVRLPTLDANELPRRRTADAERDMERVANQVAERAGFPRVIRVRVRTNPQPSGQVALTPHIEMWADAVPFEQVTSAILDAQEQYYDSVEAVFDTSLDRTEASDPDKASLFG